MPTEGGGVVDDWFPKVTATKKWQVTLLSPLRSATVWMLTKEKSPRHPFFYTFLL